MMFHGQSFEFRLEPSAGLQPGIGPGYSLRTLSVSSKIAQFFQQCQGLDSIRPHVICPSVNNGLSTQKLAAASLADKATVANLDLAAHSDDCRSSFHREPFKAIVIVVNVLCAGGNHSPVGWVEND